MNFRLACVASVAATVAGGCVGSNSGGTATADNAVSYSNSRKNSNNFFLEAASIQIQLYLN